MSDSFKLLHEIEKDQHRLMFEGLNGKNGEWAKYDEIATLNDYYAVTSHFSHILPSVFKVTPIDTSEESEVCKNVYLDINSDHEFDTGS